MPKVIDDCLSDLEDKYEMAFTTDFTYNIMKERRSSNDEAEEDNHYKFKGSNFTINDIE